MQLYLGLVKSQNKDITNNKWFTVYFEKLTGLKSEILQKQICEFMDKQFEKIPSTQHAVNLLLKFEKLNLPGLPIQEKYQRILAHYGRDIEMVSKIYQKNKNEPPVARDLPPIAGKIVRSVFGLKEKKYEFLYITCMWYDLMSCVM